MRCLTHKEPSRSYRGSTSRGEFRLTGLTGVYAELDNWKMSKYAVNSGISMDSRHSESSRPWPYWMLAAGLGFRARLGAQVARDSWSGVSFTRKRADSPRGQTRSTSTPFPSNAAAVSSEAPVSVITM